MKFVLLLALLASVRSHGSADKEWCSGRDHAVEVDDNGKVIAVDWRKDGVVNIASDQKSCGSCWSFATTGVLEAKYAQVTGQLVKFSEGYLVDCQYSYDGCAGGNAADALEKLEATQFIPSAADYPFVGYYSGKCKEADEDYRSDRNALKDVWITHYSHVQASEPALLEALECGPVPISYYISNNMINYRPKSEEELADEEEEEELVRRHDDFEIDDADIFEDAQCGRDVTPHSSLLVGYTDKAWIIKQSWGAGYGDHGYIYLARGDVATQCNLYQHVYTVDMIPRRELEYKSVDGWFNYKRGEKRCEELNKPHKSGWVLAEVPTRMHWQELKDYVKAVDAKRGFKRLRNTKKRNFDRFWIGLNLKTKYKAIYWEDGFTELAYTNFAANAGGDFHVSMHRDTGKWFTSSKKTEMRIICSRYLTCPRLSLRDIPNAESIVFGEDNAAKAEKKGHKADDIVETATATVTCKEGFEMHGEAEAVCRGGMWTLPECEDHKE